MELFEIRSWRLQYKSNRIKWSLSFLSIFRVNSPWIVYNGLKVAGKPNSTRACQVVVSWSLPLTENCMDLMVMKSPQSRNHSSMAATRDFLKYRHCQSSVVRSSLRVTVIANDRAGDINPGKQVIKSYSFSWAAVHCPTLPECGVLFNRRKNWRTRVGRLREGGPRYRLIHRQAKRVICVCHGIVPMSLERGFSAVKGANFHLRKNIVLRLWNRDRKRRCA